MPISSKMDDDNISTSSSGSLGNSYTSPVVLSSHPLVTIKTLIHTEPKDKTITKAEIEIRSKNSTAAKIGPEDKGQCPSVSTTKVDITPGISKRVYHTVKKSFTKKVLRNTFSDVRQLRNRVQGKEKSVPSCPTLPSNFKSKTIQSISVNSKLNKTTYQIKDFGSNQTFKLSQDTADFISTAASKHGLVPRKSATYSCKSKRDTSDPKHFDGMKMKKAPTQSVLNNPKKRSVDCQSPVRRRRQPSPDDNKRPVGRPRKKQRGHPKNNVGRPRNTSLADQKNSVGRQRKRSLDDSGGETVPMKKTRLSTMSQITSVRKSDSSKKSNPSKHTVGNKAVNVHLKTAKSTKKAQHGLASKQLNKDLVKRKMTFKQMKNLKLQHKKRQVGNRGTSLKKSQLATKKTRLRNAQRKTTVLKKKLLEVERKDKRRLKRSTGKSNVTSSVKEKLNKDRVLVHEGQSNVKRGRKAKQSKPIRHKYGPRPSEHRVRNKNTVPTWTVSDESDSDSSLLTDSADEVDDWLKFYPDPTVGYPTVELDRDWADEEFEYNSRDSDDEEFKYNSCTKSYRGTDEEKLFEANYVEDGNPDYNDVSENESCSIYEESDDENYYIDDAIPTHSLKGSAGEVIPDSKAKYYKNFVNAPYFFENPNVDEEFDDENCDRDSPIPCKLPMCPPYPSKKPVSVFYYVGKNVPLVRCDPSHTCCKRRVVTTVDQATQCNIITEKKLTVLSPPKKKSPTGGRGKKRKFEDPSETYADLQTSNMCHELTSSSKNFLSATHPLPCYITKCSYSPEETQSSDSIQRNYNIRVQINPDYPEPLRKPVKNYTSTHSVLDTPRSHSKSSYSDCSPINRCSEDVQTSDVGVKNSVNVITYSPLMSVTDSFPKASKRSLRSSALSLLSTKSFQSPHSIATPVNLVKNAGRVENVLKSATVMNVDTTSSCIISNPAVMPVLTNPVSGRMDINHTANLLQSPVGNVGNVSSLWIKNIANPVLTKPASGHMANPVLTKPARGHMANPVLTKPASSHMANPVLTKLPFVFVDHRHIAITERKNSVQTPVGNIDNASSLLINNLTNPELTKPSSSHMANPVSTKPSLVLVDLRHIAITESKNSVQTPIGTFDKASSLMVNNLASPELIKSSSSHMANPVLTKPSFVLVDRRHIVITESKNPVQTPVGNVDNASSLRVKNLTNPELLKPSSSHMANPISTKPASNELVSLLKAPILNTDKTFSHIKNMTNLISTKAASSHMDIHHTTTSESESRNLSNTPVENVDNTSSPIIINNMTSTPVLTSPASSHVDLNHNTNMEISAVKPSQIPTFLQDGWRLVPTPSMDSVNWKNAVTVALNKSQTVPTTTHSNTMTTTTTTSDSDMNLSEKTRPIHKDVTPVIINENTPTLTTSFNTTKSSSPSDQSKTVSPSNTIIDKILTTPKSHNTNTSSTPVNTKKVTPSENTPVYKTSIDAFPEHVESDIDMKFIKSIFSSDKIKSISPLSLVNNGTAPVKPKALGSVINCFVNDTNTSMNSNTDSNASVQPTQGLIPVKIYKIKSGQVTMSSSTDVASSSVEVNIPESVCKDRVCENMIPVRSIASQSTHTIHQIKDRVDENVNVEKSILISNQSTPVIPHVVTTVSPNIPTSVFSGDDILTLSTEHGPVIIREKKKKFA